MHHFWKTLDLREYFGLEDKKGLFLGIFFTAPLFDINMQLFFSI